ncbi:exonuclease SbcCD subunit D [Tenuibacillus multivorans]|uniref:Nuclease SbcCD subunit D n=1 Tax=Tenuibacillus multivorans TaxID=237069 RepID=A0A1H0AVC9_9BACI|nr:exonuclease SbcCD subunit D [Tenuibacillus multivorans]GEL77806.1 nuclease SbcCD subunit D [Tenuibacillus multivorans]SDN37291.1 exonuclease SbcD [Tenuibacillus multivorans]
MKIFHTADWHLGKLVQGVYMTGEQAHVLEQFLEAIRQEQPDVVVIAGDLYDRAVPPTDAVNLLDDVLREIVIDIGIPVVAIAGNHDSPGRLNFGSKIMQDNGLHIVGQLTSALEPVVLSDKYGEVHFHLVPYVDPSVVRQLFEDDEIRNLNDATERIVEKISEKMDSDARHVFVGHQFVTPLGEPRENTSESERPLSIGGAEHVDAKHFEQFNYTALGHLHQAHHVGQETVRYSGSPLKYSISEEHHKKGYLVVEMDADGDVTVAKRELSPRRDIRTVEATMDELLNHETSEDYVFVRLLDETPVLYPMEKIRSIYPNAMHVERKNLVSANEVTGSSEKVERHKMSDLELFRAFYEEVKGEAVSEETEDIFKEVLNDELQQKRETVTHK